jgi:hypothetical protein
LGRSAQRWADLPNARAAAWFVAEGIEAAPRWRASLDPYGDRRYHGKDERSRLARRARSLRPRSRARSRGRPAPTRDERPGHGAYVAAYERVARGVPALEDTGDGTPPSGAQITEPPAPYERGRVGGTDGSRDDRLDRADGGRDLPGVPFEATLGTLLVDCLALDAANMPGLERPLAACRGEAAAVPHDARSRCSVSCSRRR